MFGDDNDVNGGTNDDKITVVIIEYDMKPQSSCLSSKLPNTFCNLNKYILKLG